MIAKSNNSKLTTCGNEMKTISYSVLVAYFYAEITTTTTTMLNTPVSAEEVTHGLIEL